MDNFFRIRFEKPNLPELTACYTVVDMHFHSCLSDGRNTVAQIARQARALGIGIAITDHNGIEGALEIDRYDDILSIPGIELTSREGTHLLVYFYDLEALKRFYDDHVRPFMGPELMSSLALNMEQLIERARAFETLIIFPHPHCAVFTGIHNTYFPEEHRMQLYAQVDGVEVINAGNLKKWNLKSALLGFNLGQAITGGSDGHRLEHMGNAVSYASTPKDRRAFLDAVKSYRSKVVGKEFGMLEKVASNGYKLKTNIKNYPDIVEKNLRYSRRVITLKSQTLKEKVKRRLQLAIKDPR